MIKAGITILLLFAFFRFVTPVKGQEGWEVDNFQSQINIERDTDISVTETIVADFGKLYKHGIYRYIPHTYSAKGKTIRTDVDILEVTDETGRPIPYSQNRDSKSVEVKIGDPNITVTGENTYVIDYRVSDVIQRFDGHDELYWNVLGSGWDVDILEVAMSVQSRHADIIDRNCFTGIHGSTESNCSVDSMGSSHAGFMSDDPLGRGRDMSIAVGLDKQNDLVFPTRTEIVAKKLSDNWGYALSLIPIVFVSIFWWRKGRDRRYLDDNVYREAAEEGRLEKTASFFERKFLPLTYRPIDNLSPAEVGVITDDRIDLPDIVAEIVELARLGFIQIEKFEVKKRLAKDEIDYAFVKTTKYDEMPERSKLKDYQDYILKELFRPTSIHKSVKSAEKLFAGDDKKLNKVWKLLANREYVLLSGLKNHFYEGLPVIKEKVYKKVAQEGYFDGRPDEVRTKWIFLSILIDGVALAICFIFFGKTGNIGPVVIISLFFVPTLVIAYFMPRRSAKGYAYKRQIEGLKWYLNKGKWRHEIAEKKLFFEDVLPLAIALGVVDKLSEDMQTLTVMPPNYIGGITAASFASDFGNFNRSLTSTVISSPRSSGSSWSGGSGFSGGSSGGGFGGGGGGSW